MVELIITEKPSTANKIAHALAEGKVNQQKTSTVSSFKITHKGKEIIVVSAVGHLYTLTEAEKKGWIYPVFDVKWVSSAEVNKESAFTAKYLNVIKKMAKDADEFTIATDYDIEGEVIGYNILRFACKQKDGRRMKFSTVTKADLVKAYDSKKKSIDWGQANAGLTRHELDWYYGINLSRALTSAIKKAGFFKVLSSGRVQGPTLKIIVEKEKEIKAFISEPYWQIQLLGKVKNEDIEAWHKADKFWKKEEADIVMQKTKGKDGVVDKVDRNQYNQSPPNPFDLTSLQIEAYRCFKINPKDSLALAQELYSAGLISYPRTSSQVYPVEIGFANILNAIAKQSEYKALAEKLLAKKDLKPNNGQKTDPAHPAIYPTGLVSKKMEGRYKRIYDLIVRRFMATFAENAVRETMTIDIDVNTEIFIARGTRTLEKGWHIYYGEYAKYKEVELPNVAKGDAVKVKDIICHDKQTEPPRRYTPASIIKELEKRNLGTKATRASIVDTLFTRGYVDGKSIEATNLGIQTVDTLEKYCPKIQDEELTRHFEEDMGAIREEKKKSEEVLHEAKDILLKILDGFKKHEKEIGDGLKGATIESNTKANTVGKCPVCKEGNLMIKKGKYGKFMACSRYPDCKAIFKLPGYGNVKVLGRECEECGFPMLKVLKKRGAQDVCINPDCPAKTRDKEGNQITAPEIIKNGCPKCGKDLKLRKSFYGQFYGCSAYPECRHIQNLDGTSKRGRQDKAGEKSESGVAPVAQKKGVKKTAKGPVKKAAKPAKKAAVKKGKLPSVDEL